MTSEEHSVSNTRYGILTGAASGLGRALALRLADEGWHLALVDRDAEGAAETLVRMRTRGGEGRVEPMDVTDADAWSALSKRLRAEWPALDLLVNNAGVAAAGRIGEMPVADWRWVMEINFLGCVQATHVFIDWLKANRNGAAILNVCSASAFMSAPTMGAYSTSKAAMLAFSETLYTELFGSGISVTVLLPYFFKTRLIERGRFGSNAQQQAAEQAVRKSSATVDSVADLALKAMRRKQFYVTTPFRESTLAWRLKRLNPMALLNNVAREGQRRLTTPQD